MKPRKDKKIIEFGSKTVIAIILFIIFILILFLTLTHYKNQINKNVKEKHNEPEPDTTFELTYKRNEECLSYLDNLKDINHNTLNVSNYKDTILLYNTVYEDCTDGSCNDETKKETEKQYIVCLTDIKYSNEEEEYNLEEALEKKKITIEELENKLNKDGLSKIIIKEEVKYDTTAPVLDIGYVYIDEGQTYTVDRFIKSCKDDSGEKCILSFTKEEMSEYTKVGTYDVEISAKDSSGNEVKKTTRLIIRGKQVAQKPQAGTTNNDQTTTPTNPEPKPSDSNQTSGDGNSGKEEDKDKDKDKDNTTTDDKNTVAITPNNSDNVVAFIIDNKISNEEIT